MNNEQLTQYIAAERARGVSDEALRAALLTSGWKEEDINVGMGVVGGVSAPSTTAPTAPLRTALMPVMQLISESFSEMMHHILLILGIVLFPVLFFVSGGLMFLFSVAGIIVGIVLILAGIVALMLSSLAIIIEIREGWKLSIIEAYTAAVKRFFSALWVSILTGGVVMAGMLLVFAPMIFLTFVGDFLSLDFIPMPIGIVLVIAYAACALLVLIRLSMWYLFPRYALIIDDVRGIAALAYGRALARGLEGKILWRMICIVVPMIVASLIPIVGQLLALLFSPLAIIYTARLYADVKSFKGIAPAQTEKKHRTITLILAWVGIVSVAGMFALTVFFGLFGFLQDLYGTRDMQGFIPTSGTPIFTVPEELPAPSTLTSADLVIWKSVTIGTYKDTEALRAALLAQHFEIGYWAKPIFDQKAFTVSQSPSTLDLVIVNSSDLAPGTVTVGDVYIKANALGLELCPAEVGPDLRLAYTDQPTGEELTVASEPTSVKDTSGKPEGFNIFKLGHFYASAPASLDAGLGNLTTYTMNTKYVFCRSHVQGAESVAVPAALTPPSIPLFTPADLAQCLTKKKVFLYGTFWAPTVQTQKAMFGAASSSLPYVECSTADAHQTPICLQKKITSYPTWEFPGGKMVVGQQTLDGLSVQSGCAIVNK